MRLRIFIYLLTWKLTTAKVSFRFYKQCSQGTTRLNCEPAIFAQNTRGFLALIFLKTLKKTFWKNYVRSWKWNLKGTAQNSFSRKSILEFCIAFNMISFANSQG